MGQDHVSFRERLIMDDSNPALAERNRQKMNDFSGVVDSFKNLLKKGDVLQTHYVLKYEPQGEPQYILIGDAGVPTAFCCRRLAEEAVAANKKMGCSYLVLAVANRIDV